MDILMILILAAIAGIMVALTSWSQHVIDEGRDLP